MSKVAMRKDLSKKNIKVLHTAALLSPPSGIISQMTWEQDAALNLDIEWRVQMYCPLNSENISSVSFFDKNIDRLSIKTPLDKLIAWFKLRRNYHEWLLNQQDDIDIFVLRYYVHDPFQLRFLKRCKKPVYLVHHTLEEPELKLPGGFSGWLRSQLESQLGKPTISTAKGIIGVTQEILNYEKLRSSSFDKASFIYPNGIIYKTLDLLDKRNEKIPELLFVANFAPWHGLDLLLNELTKSNEKFILHLVGNLTSDLQVLAQDKRVIVHGRLNHEEIIELSQRCWIGLSSFALQRNKMKEACPLKVREYLMLGLPVYGNYKDIFPKESVFFKEGDENIDEILRFAYDSRNLNKREVALMAKDQIDKEVLLSKLCNWLLKE
ncbi:glycosyltransferase family 4 protein [Acinetobacter radioresistens]|uniref:glycosyltransferase family 4 protein n=1 Tax=Acinetobacter radioresistens TaxID=40216 RepID=UPI0020038ED9|nr:glycosyltransferase family 4 protein [Acinetobacter radioresistens]MCK4078406.1 glycosyltransferase family 4 protein [Acinetobacter radioresistens]MCK4084561.1 glycosyltransferase family 4 protein [Acinetobacter radioresistens]